jgi:hypothetical protein
VPSRRPAPRRLLVIDCDAGTLETQGLALGGELARSPLLLYEFEVTYIAIDDKVSLRHQLDNLGRRRFHAVVVVGHSNASGIRAASDLFLPWSDFARRLAKLRPEKMLLIACQAGDLGVTQELFSALKTLRRAYACPLNLPRSQAGIVVQAAPLVLSAVDLAADLRLLLQGLLLLAKNGLFFEHRREEFLNEKAIQEATAKTSLGLLLYLAQRGNRDRGPVYA